MQLVPFDKLADFCAAVFSARGLAEDDARYVGDMVATTEAFGITTHGVNVVLAVAGQVGEKIDPAAEPKVVAESGAAATIDGEGVLGQLCMRLAKRLAVAKAREHGVAMVAVRKTSWLGAVGPFLIDIAEGGMLAIATAQSSACEDCAPVGGIDATFSTNPIALAIPAEGDPILADFSTAAYSMGKSWRMARAGEKAPEPIFLDKDGVLTDEPGVVDDGGSVLFMGGRNFGHKGYALSLWCEALAVLAGGNANNPELPQTQSFSLTVIDPQALAGSDHFQTEMKRFLARVKASRPRPGADPIRLPGQRGFAALREARRNGVPMDEETVGKLNEIASANGVRLTL